MANFNSVVLVGRLTRDPELRYSPSGVPICSFTVATSRRYTKENSEKADATTFLDVDVWRRMAEISAQFLKKGRQVLVMGTLRQSRWMDPKTQEPQSKIRIIAQQVQVLGRDSEATCPAAEGDPEVSDE